MDLTLYKDVKVSRDFNYHYYYSPAKDSKSTILFCHGFPSTSRDWRFSATYFQEKGYGVLVPDMLGYGGTAKPIDPALYVGSGLTRDIIDILDAEKLDKIIAIGHDWGCRVVSKLATWFPERILAYAFFAVTYTPPNPVHNYEQNLKVSKEKFGYEQFGYWEFFSADDAEQVIFDHWDAFCAMLFPNDPSTWETHLAPLGALRKTLTSDYASPRPTYWTEEDRKLFTETFQKNGFKAPLCWYKVQTSGLSSQDDAAVPKSKYIPPSSSPIFFGAALHDRVCLASIGASVFRLDAFKDHKVTVKEYDGDHWLIISHADQVNRDLESWIVEAGL
ncbi:epoxide hydrolase [Abortiporus biennis]|nr:epoxide hydrolase [Abortiporus biennis]